MFVMQNACVTPPTAMLRPGCGSGPATTPSMAVGRRAGARASPSHGLGQALCFYFLPCYIFVTCSLSCCATAGTGQKPALVRRLHPLYQRRRPKPSQRRPSVPRPDGCSGPAPIRPDPSRPRPDPGVRPKPESGHPTLRPRSVHPRLRPRPEPIHPRLRPRPEPIHPRVRPRPEPTHPRVRPRPQPHPRVRPRRRAQARSQRPASGLLSGSFRPRPRHRRRGARRRRAGQRRARGCQSRERYWAVTHRFLFLKQ